MRRRDGRVAEGARLESVFRGNSNVGSNPTLSASFKRLTWLYLLFPCHLNANTTTFDGLGTSPLSQHQRRCSLWFECLRAGLAWVYHYKLSSASNWLSYELRSQTGNGI